MLPLLGFMYPFHRAHKMKAQFGSYVYLLYLFQLAYPQLLGGLIKFSTLCSY